MNKRIFVLILGMILLIQSVDGLGITPGRTGIKYVPGIEEEVSFTVLNSGNEDIDLVVLIQGDFNESVSVSEVSFSMTKEEKTKELRYKVKIPELTPGSHIAEIVIVQLPGKSPTSEAFVGAVVGVVTQAHIFVPFPGKYAEASMNVIGPEDGKVTFVIPVLNRGDLDIVRAGSEIDIFSSLNEKIATVNTNEVSIPAGSKREIVATWDSKSVDPGPYRAVATVLYDEDVIKIEKEFNVGKRLLELNGVEVNDFTLGEIAKFEMLVENKWGDPIRNAYAQMLVYNEKEEVMADFKSQTYNLEPLSKILMTAFWDTDGVKKGTYDSSMFLRYGKNSEQKDFKLEVKDKEINVIGVGYVISETSSGSAESSGLVTILIIVVVVLVLINLVWFLVLRKKLSRKK
jgi:hypothetical protein